MSPLLARLDQPSARALRRLRTGRRYCNPSLRTSWLDLALMVALGVVVLCHAIPVIYRLACVLSME